MTVSEKVTRIGITLSIPYLPSATLEETFVTVGAVVSRMIESSALTGAVSILPALSVPSE